MQVHNVQGLWFTARGGQATGLTQLGIPIIRFKGGGLLSTLGPVRQGFLTGPRSGAYTLQSYRPTVTGYLHSPKHTTEPCYTRYRLPGAFFVELLCLRWDRHRGLEWCVNSTRHVWLDIKRNGAGSQLLPTLES